MNVFAIEYTYCDDMELVAEVRPKHREFLAQLKEEGKLVGSGPYTDDRGGALIIIRLPEPATLADAEALMAADPYLAHNALAERVFRPWNPVLNVFN
ncbi:YciI family protein [Corynebacterium sp.]|uniref:YciI family protein n=1 Tax=Corynebacterium sp. TaxID=1720 RepID=UPI0026DB1920|nr:YciI family protein [Corynebacterium sp.]MDO5075731.1 YciI family protein [Corynebacterium sp.]